MESAKKGAGRKSLALQLSVIALLVFAGMASFEILNQIAFPNITMWGSHLLTIVFGTACAVAASFGILRRQIMLNRELTEKNITGERLQRELEQTVENLSAALSQVKTLRGMLPICSACKKIRDDKGYWNQIETYIRERSDAEFSHGICPECARKLYPEIYAQERSAASAPNSH